MASCYRGDPTPYPIINKDLRYFLIFGRWTQNARVYRDFDTALYLDVTYHSREFRKAYVAELARIQHLSVKDQQKLLADEEEDYQKHMTFTVNVYTPVWDWNDLEKANSIWKIIILDSMMNEYTPFSIHVVSKHDSQAKYFYPYMNIWSVCYRIKFRRNDIQLSDDRFNLDFSSVIGSKRFQFEDPEFNKKIVAPTVQKLPSKQPPPIIPPPAEPPLDSDKMPDIEGPHN